MVAIESITIPVPFPLALSTVGHDAWVTALVVPGLFLFFSGFDNVQALVSNLCLEGLPYATPCPIQ